MARSTSEFERMLEYRRKHAGWIIFRSVYWAIYLLVLGGVLLYYSGNNVSVSFQAFAGIALSLLALMIIVQGVAEVLHNKLMRKHA